jgi:hypothetical protein
MEGENDPNGAASPHIRSLKGSETRPFLPSKDKKPRSFVQHNDLVPHLQQRYCRFRNEVYPSNVTLIRMRGSTSIFGRVIPICFNPCPLSLSDLGVPIDFAGWYGGRVGPKALIWSVKKSARLAKKLKVTLGLAGVLSG